MNHLIPEPQSVDQPNEKPALLRVLDTLKECYDRAFRQVDSEPLPEPNREKDQPIDLDIYRKAVATLDLDRPALEKKFQQLCQFVEIAQPAALRDKFPAGQKICYNVIPFYDAGAPSAELHLCRVSAKGLTFGPTSDPAYFFLNFPLEIQKHCTFSAPIYQNPSFVSENERAELKKSLQSAWDNLCLFLDLKAASENK